MSSLARPLRSIALASSLLIPTACAGPDLEEAEGEAPILNLSTAPFGPSTTGSIPALPSLVPGGGAFPPDVVGGVYTNGRDLNAAPTGSGAAWRTSMTSDPFSTRPPLAPFLSSAHTMAEGRASEVDVGAIDSALDALGDIGGAGSVTTTTRHAGYKPVQARWISSQTNCVGFPICTPSTTNYSPPAHFGELRDRGARLFCAAREATFRQPGTGVTMGSRSAGGFDIFGERVDFLVVEPTAVIAPPAKFLDPTINDGAQAFSVPLSLGTRFTPIRGLGLPSLPEIRTPLTLVAADTEVRNRANRVTPPVGASYFANTHHTVTFGEDVVSTGLQAHAELPELTLFSVFVFDASLKLSFDLAAGNVTPVRNSLLRDAPITFPSPRLGFPPYVYDPWGTSAYYDGNWKLATTTPGMGSIRAEAGVAADFLARNDPFLTKAIQDADYAVESKTTAGATVELLGSAGFDVGPLALEFVISGGITADASMIHEVRDAERAALAINPNLAPIAGVVVTPKMEGNVKFVSEAYVDIALLFASWRVQIYDFTSPPLVHVADDPWPEPNRFRLGTASRVGNVTRQPNVRSHFPGQPEFPSFPMDVDACLADTRIPPSTPPPCGSTPGTPGGAPRAELCAFAGFQTNSTICGDIPGIAMTSGSTDEQRGCVGDLLSFLCQPVSLEQIHTGQRVVARVVESNPGFGEALESIVQSCADAFSEEWVQDTLDFGLCRSNAALFAPGAAVTPAPSGGPSAPGTCL